MRNPELTLTHPGAKKQHLIGLADTIPGAWIGIKVAALLLVVEGQRPGWIAEVLGVTRICLSRWIHRVNEEGLEGLEPKAKPGRPARIDSRVQKKLEQHLEKSPREFGLNRVQWDGPTLATHLKREFGINLKVRQAQKWRHQLGYRLKRAGYTSLPAKAEEAERFRRRLKKTSKTGTRRDGGLSG